jgi:hypothetical protein
MIIEIATAAAMYWSDRALAAESDIPHMLSPAAVCRYRDPQKLRQCLNAKMQPEPDPMAAMWDPNWVSSVTPISDSSITNTSANTANPNVAKKPLK